MAYSFESDNPFGTAFSSTPRNFFLLLDPRNLAESFGNSMKRKKGGADSQHGTLTALSHIFNP
jgi:hypothetical protein